jgi:predicted secreted hydrolase
MRTFQRYPIKWRLEVPGAKIKIVVTATMPTQEFQTIIAFPAFWEGRCDVVGTRKGRKVSGLCFIERHGWEEGEFSFMYRFILRESCSQLTRSP